MNYYNEFDSQAAQWLRNLIAAGLIPDGDVDERSIEDVTPNELRGYTQCHFFAGIAGWSLALDLAGWPRDRPVWTGSCPCQPFSAAGKGDGFKDERHLWPAFQHLIAQCRPPVVFGEQVASKATDAWVDLVHADLENMDYTFGCIPFSAASIGAPHIRDRNYWVADANDSRLEGRQRVQQRSDKRLAGAGGMARGLADTDSWKRDGLAIVEWNERIGDDAGRSQECGKPQPLGDFRRLADANIIAGRQGSQVNGGRDSRGDAESRAGSGSGVVFDGMADTTGAGRRPERQDGDATHIMGPISAGQAESGRIGATDDSGPLHGFWRNADWIFCRDGKWRPVEPGTFPLAHGVSARVVRLRAYGNSIVPQAAAEFIRAYLETQQGEMRAAA